MIFKAIVSDQILFSMIQSPLYGFHKRVGVAAKIKFDLDTMV